MSKMHRCSSRKSRSGSIGKSSVQHFHLSLCELSDIPYHTDEFEGGSEIFNVQMNDEVNGAAKLKQEKASKIKQLDLDLSLGKG